MIDTTRKMLPIGEYEYVDVKFANVGNDIIVNYTKLHVEDVEKVRWLDVSPSQDARVFRGVGSTFGVGYIALQSNVANYSTRLLIFTERTESNA